VTDYEQLKARTAAMWSESEYEGIADQIRPAARSLVDACAISAGQEVLDVGAGNVNLALYAAEEGADVTATDIAPGQVERGKARTSAEGVDVQWLVADAESLPFEDESFECVASVFGAIFAPRPEVVAAELFRVVKPGNTVGITAWGDYGAQAEIFATAVKYGPPLPDDVPPPRLWGLEEVVEERFGPYAGTIETNRRFVRFAFPSLDAAIELYTTNGPGKALADNLSPEDFAKWRAEFEEVAARWDVADGDGVAYEAEYLEVVARKRG
jgi:2-polyprenyl-6-hydroxyphenyl methylase/3-demethylubiquinone-9 3-methyltransferase